MQNMLKNIIFYSIIKEKVKFYLNPHTTLYYYNPPYISRPLVKKSLKKWAKKLETAVIIAEYNPFHNGHKYLADKARELGFTHIAAVMSGSFTQRGEAALLSKFDRARAALLSGVDLVAELPVTCAVSSAERFARGGVYIADSLGADALLFGSECGDLKQLLLTVDLLNDEKTDRLIKENLTKGMTYAAARHSALKDAAGGDVPSDPNDNLGIEYISAIKKLHSNLTPIAVKREGAGHDSPVSLGNSCSASYIRESVLKGNIQKIKPFMPELSFEILEKSAAEGKIADFKRLHTALLYKLRTMEVEDFARLPDISEGLENRLFSAARTAADYNDFLFSVKSKRYTLSRIRRIAVNALLGITKSDYQITPDYIRILGLNDRGAEILKSPAVKLPVVTKPTLLKNNPLFKIEARAADIFGLAFKNPQKCGTDFTNGIIKF